VPQLVENLADDEILGGDMCSKAAINWGRGNNTTNQVVINTFAPASTDTN